MKQKLSSLVNENKLAQVEFVSGRRRYVARVFEADAPNSAQRQIAVLLERQKQSGHSMVSKEATSFKLTDRERQVSEFLLTGLSTKEIAFEMHLSPNTVKSFLRSLMLKTGAPTRAGILSKLGSRKPAGKNRHQNN